ncbi:MAG: 50S ribosomal protein L30 [Gammaproteobacteria bacterium]|nr:50S ribosomal protein L30 [Gammaproteobacteria bacterium]
MSKTIDITLVKSLIGRLPKHKDIAKQLGLRKINSTVVKPNTPAILGMVHKIDYLVEIKESVE